MKKENKCFDQKGRKIIRRIVRKSYTINFVKQDDLEQNLDRLYEVIAELLIDKCTNNKTTN
ncbi:hypothetical protein [Cytobacillus sp. FSL H8-0458]|uniref:hypothetical protein n=1 Tax=Cytobacillus sp. FSL H8-0458 TaxID=2975346 RepID=UPI0030FC8D54